MDHPKNFKTSLDFYLYQLGVELSRQSLDYYLHRANRIQAFDNFPFLVTKTKNNKMQTSNQLNEYTQLLEEYLYWSAEGKTQWQITAQLINTNLELSYKLQLVSNALKIIRKKAGKMSCNDLDNFKNPKVD